MKVNALFTPQTTFITSCGFDSLNAKSAKRLGTRNETACISKHVLNSSKISAGVRLFVFFFVKRTKINIDTKSFTCKNRVRQASYAVL